MTTVDNRGVSPVVGVALMLVIVVLIAAAVGVMLLSFTDDLPDTTEVFVEDDCPGFHIAEYETGEFSAFVDDIRQNDCALWLEHGEVELEEGGEVEQWRDSGPHGFHASQSNSSIQPDYDDRKVIFDASANEGDQWNGQHLQLDRDVDDLDLDANRGIAVAAVVAVDTFDRNGLWTIGEAGESGREFSLRTCSDRPSDGCNSTDPEGEWRAQLWDKSDVDFSSGNDSAGKQLVLVQGYDGDEVFIRVNGEEVARDPVNLDLSANRDIQLGRWDRTDDDTYWYFNGSISEVIVFDHALEKDTIDLFEAYLSSEHDIDLEGRIED